MTPIGNMTINPKVQFRPITALSQVFATEPEEVASSTYPATAFSFVINRAVSSPTLTLTGSITYPYTELLPTERVLTTKNTPLEDEGGPWSVEEIANKILRFFLDRPVFKETDKETPVFSLVATGAGDLSEGARPYTSDAVKEALILGLSFPHTVCCVGLGLSSITLHYQNCNTGTTESRTFVVGMESSDDAPQ